MPDKTANIGTLHRELNEEARQEELVKLKEELERKEKERKERNKVNNE